MTKDEKRRAVRDRIEAVQTDFYAPLIGLIILELYPEKTVDEIVALMLDAYKTMEFDEYKMREVEP